MHRIIQQKKHQNKHLALLKSSLRKSFYFTTTIKRKKRFKKIKPRVKHKNRSQAAKRDLSRNTIKYQNHSKYLSLAIQMKKNEIFFAKSISSWGKTNNRKMPWKGEKNPYLIWLSEIILQQTRVEQGLSYFIAFKEKYPTVKSLAMAPEQDVLKLWEGLGYYSRARNLHFTAKYISKELNGIFPSHFSELLKLKGIGAYTAAAIASFAFDEKKAVVDGNVIRVLSRHFGIENQFHTAQEKRDLQNFADLLIATQNPSIYNQAIMDFGAQICTPKQVDCSPCFLQESCYAYRTDKQLELPLSKKKIKQKERYFNFFVFRHQNDVYIEQRLAKDIWKGLHQFPLYESEETTIKDYKKIQIIVEDQLDISDFEIKKTSKTYKQKLTHQKLEVVFIEIKLETALNKHFLNVNIKNLSNFAFPKIINVYLKDKFIN